MKLIPVFFVIVLTFNVFSETDTRTVKSRFNRCENTLRRVERLFSRYQETLDRIGQVVENDSETVNRFNNQFSRLENRVDYFQNRIERIHNQRNSLHEELQTQGPTCPSCVESNVHLFCRTAEMLLSDIEEYIDIASDLYSQIREYGSVFKKSPIRDQAKFKERKVEMDSLYQVFGNLKNSCEDPSVNILYQQAEENLTTAQKLFHADKVGEAMENLEIFEQLFNMTLQRCYE
ncbi:hypothetical protein QA601_02005 [Chitinispirillales bacterium ANBcel5]|uniref:hypothetical protein n=1 Tax=Cellulosispirillum alkaliphilum TaxID=3039283 RepID=UPI002A4FAF3F|nr:hypothetical protein [Chitinispirillales bacterium ANBcel5]